MERTVRRGEIVELASAVKYASEYADRRGYFSLIGGAIFSAGAGGRAGLVAAPWVCGSGRAGSGAGVVGRSPPGLASAGVLS